MYLLRQRTSPNHVAAQFEIYRSCDGRWQYEKSFEVEHSREFYTCIGNYHYDFRYAIIEMETLYRNTLYYFYPNIKIAIHEKAVRSYVRQLLDITPETFEEVAVSLEDGKKLLEIELLRFVEYFYSFKDKSDALFSYARWQYERPLNEAKYSKFVRMMEFYLDEILNYFDLRSIEMQLRK